MTKVPATQQSSQHTSLATTDEGNGGRSNTLYNTDRKVVGVDNCEESVLGGFQSWVRVVKIGV
jgi:hypothetical protein